MIPLIVNGKPLRLGGELLSVTPGEAVESGGAVLTVADFSKDRFVFQRVGDEKLVPVSGTTNGAATIQARAVDADTGAALTAWANVATPSGAGSFTGTHLVPKTSKGKFYKMQVRDLSAPAGSVAQTSNRFSVGIRGALAGQSNMVGMANETASYPLGGKGSFEYRNGAFQRVGNINDTFAANTLYGGAGYSSFTGEGKVGDGYVYIANMLADALDTNVCLVERAQGGTSMAQWMTGQACWNDLTATFAEIGNDCEFALWLQGENDAGDGMSTATMIARLADLHGQFKTLTGRNDSNFHFGVISLGAVSSSSGYSGGSTAKVGAIRAAHVQYANSAAGAFFATAMHDTQTSDGVHIVGSSYNRAGRRIGKSVAARLGVGTSCAGPRVTSAARSGNVVTLNVQHSGGNALLDGSGGTGSMLTGFDLRDASNNPITYTTAITGATTIQLTAASAPSTVAYAMNNAPHSSDPTVSTTAPVLASAVYDNATYFEGATSPFGISAVGGILQPFAAMAITGS